MIEILGKVFAASWVSSGGYTNRKFVNKRVICMLGLMPAASLWEGNVIARLLWLESGLRFHAKRRWAGKRELLAWKKLKANDVWCLLCVGTRS
jgi:hypothetical protein